MLKAIDLLTGKTMNVRRLELLMHVSDFGSFSKSSAVLGIAQPALGRQIQKLEEEYGIRLLYRHGRGVSLTPEGQQLIARAKPLLRQLESIVTDLQASTEELQGTVTLGLTPTICNLIGVPLLRSLSEKHPKLAVSIVSGYSGYVHEWLIDGRLDIAILHDARRSATVAVEPISQARLFLITPPNLPIHKNKQSSISISALSDTPLVLPNRNHGLRRTVELAASQANIELNVRYEVDTLSVALDLVVAGMASSILARPAYKNLLEQGQIAEVAIAQPVLETKLMIAEASNRPMTRGMRAVRQEILSIFQDFSRDPTVHGLTCTF
jgi:LysR family nitrogen assimilation transcriptional regulator